MTYKHLTKEDRIQIQTLHNAKYSNNYIAAVIGCDPSTISRELNRCNCDYKYSFANNQATKLRKTANQLRTKLIESNIDLLDFVESKLKEDLTPEQIVGRIKLENLTFGGNKITIKSHQTIYDWIYEKRPDLVKYLACKKGKYRRRYGTRIREKEKIELEKKRIDKRSDIVEDRTRLGDWEGDTIVGKDKIHILTHVDRMSGYLIANLLPEATALDTQKSTLEAFKTVPKNKLHTITYDNGVQFSKHQDTEKRLNTEIYFAYPYHSCRGEALTWETQVPLLSWERGTNENTNGLLRRYFPKGTNFNEITQEVLDRVVKMINNRPRKRHNYHSPQEIWDNPNLKLQKIALGIRM
jgi:transposase, IS30 family